MNFRNFKNVANTVFGPGSFEQTDEILSEKRGNSFMTFLLDDVFDGKELEKRIPLHDGDLLIKVDISNEPKTSYVDELRQQVMAHTGKAPDGVIGIGGGSTMDLAKAVALMLTNPGSSADYQGWDLIKNPAAYHAAIPTLSGTGACVSRTTVLTGPEKKLGINSDYTVFDQIILDPELIKDVPPDQRFYTGMDCFIHCIESLEGTFLNAFSRGYAEKACELCLEVFLASPDDDSEDADGKLMMASLFGGLSIAYSQVGVCHAMSYGLSFVLGTRHGIGNSIVFNVLDEYYPEGVKQFREMLAKQDFEMPANIMKDVSDDDIDKMIDVALILEPLWENALGKDWKQKITREKLKEIYKRM